MNRFHCKSGFSKNIIKPKTSLDETQKFNLDNLFNENTNEDPYATRTYQLQPDCKKVPKLKDVAHRIDSELSLERVNAIKKDYFNSCQDLISTLNDHRKKRKKRLIGRSAKIAVSLGMVALIVLIIVISQIKVITLIIDGEKKTTTTNQYFTPLYISKLADKYKFSEYEYESTTGDTISNGTIINVETLKPVVLTIKDEEVNDETYSTTIKEYIEEKTQDNKAILKDKYTYYSKEYNGKEDNTLIKDVPKLTLFLKSTNVVEKELTSKYKVKYVDNKNLESGKQKVKQNGQDGKYIKKYETIYLNDKKYKTVVTTAKVLSNKKDKIIERGTKVAAPTSDVWDRLARCESGGRWHLNSGNGFYGGIQFSAPTWRTAAGKVGVSAPYAHLATKEEQIKAASWLQKNSGWGQWPACSKKLGLR